MEKTRYGERPFTKHVQRRAEARRCFIGAEALAQDHYFIVVREVGRYVGQAGATVDVMFVGMVALIRAADRYSDTHRDAGVTFERYARWWIRHAMERAIARAQRE